MKILFFITQAEMGGAQKYILEFASAIQKSGNFETLVASEKNDSFKNALAKENVKFIELKHIKRSINPLSDISAFFEIFKLIKSEKPDIVHLNSSKMGVIGAFAGKWANVPKIVFTAHGWVFNEILPFWKRWIYVFASRLSAVFQDQIICVSSYDKKTALKYKVATEEKLFVVNNGIDEEKIKFLSREEARRSLSLQNGTVVGSIANLYENKGLKYLLEAAKNILKEKNDILFAIIGEGPERKNLEREIKKYGIEKSFLLLGAKENATSYLKAFDIFVLPSQKEGFPYALLEAGLAKLPVVTTNVGGIPDIANEENSVVVLPRSSEDLKNAIENLIENTEKQNIISENLYKDIKEKFSFKKMLEKTLEVYESR